MASKERNSLWSEEFVHLVEGKDFSRLLYANPVCFLCTPSNDEICYQSNVMVISWLTAINNDGHFVMSINRRRHSAKYMATVGREFCLCVPVAGMEPLILAVGGTSGRFGSKFMEEHSSGPCLSDTGNGDRNKEQSGHHATDAQPSVGEGSTAEVPLSKRQRKRLEREALRRGIPDLVMQPYHDKEDDDDDSSSGLFYIQGTVASLRCRIYIVNKDDGIEDGHTIIFARILDAYCHSDYWNEEKKIFRPKQGVKTFLTFLGSQTFGHVIAASAESPEAPCPTNG